jgi:hypothetical protein
MLETEDLGPAEDGGADAKVDVRPASSSRAAKLKTAPPPASAYGLVAVGALSARSPRLASPLRCPGREDLVCLQL